MKGRWNVELVFWEGGGWVLTFFRLVERMGRGVGFETNWNVFVLFRNEQSEKQCFLKIFCRGVEEGVDTWLCGIILESDWVRMIL